MRRLIYLGVKNTKNLNGAYMLLWAVSLYHLAVFVQQIFISIPINHLNSVVSQLYGFSSILSYENILA